MLYSVPSVQKGSPNIQLLFTGGDNGPNHTIAAGVHQYRFSFRLPTEFLPSSYEGEYGAIRYWLALQIDRPLLRFNIDRFKIITVLDHIDVNAPEFSVSETLQKIPVDFTVK